MWQYEIASQQWVQIFSGGPNFIGNSTWPSARYVNLVWFLYIFLIVGLINIYFIFFLTSLFEMYRYGMYTYFDGINLWMFGGKTAAGAGLNEMWKYNIGTSSWSLISYTSQSIYLYFTLPFSLFHLLTIFFAAIPTQRMDGSACGGGNKIYIYGGVDTTAVVLLAEMWEYDIISSSWTLLLKSSTLRVYFLGLFLVLFLVPFLVSFLVLFFFNFNADFRKAVLCRQAAV
jgi:hypothetical protein